MPCVGAFCIAGGRQANRNTFCCATDVRCLWWYELYTGIYSLGFAGLGLAWLDVGWCHMAWWLECATRTMDSAPAPYGRRVAASTRNPRARTLVGFAPSGAMVVSCQLISFICLFIFQNPDTHELRLAQRAIISPLLNDSKRPPSYECAPALLAPHYAMLGGAWGGADLVTTHVLLSYCPPACLRPPPSPASNPVPLPRP